MTLTEDEIRQIVFPALEQTAGSDTLVVRDAREHLWRVR